MHRSTLLLYSVANEPSIDRRTSLADARIALCLESGVAIDDIDPASGYNHSRAAYDRARASWIDLIRHHGASSNYEVRDIERARARWVEVRPEYVTDDWLTAALDAHRVHVAALGRPCGKSECVVHAPLPAKILALINEVSAQ
ncbi:hypothetical protein [Streptomyces sp. NPDC006134]|uniref:hypothetical protein n=1 Tax=Streptomyces sp. NPDC006134 TaxID=3154467 RepID=UPI0033F5F484